MRDPGRYVDDGKANDTWRVTYTESSIFVVVIGTDKMLIKNTSPYSSHPGLSNGTTFEPMASISHNINFSQSI